MAYRKVTKQEQLEKLEHDYYQEVENIMDWVYAMPAPLFHKNAHHEILKEIEKHMEKLTDLMDKAVETNKKK